MNRNMKKKAYQEPAKLSYFFSQGYVDLKDTIVAAWKRNFNNIKYEASRLKDRFNPAKFIYHLMALVGIALFGTIFVSLFTVVHVVLLAIMMAVVYLGFVLLRAADQVFCWIKGLSTNCYNPGCARKFSLPVYPCPNCHREHRKLVPSKYGITRRICECGYKLPTSFLNGRQKLDSLCPHCGFNAINGLHTSLLIPVIGGANAGKTCFINMAISEIEKEADSLNLDFQYQRVANDKYEDNKNRMEKGICPEKTGDLSLKYYNFCLTTKGQKVDNLISVCDIAGEVFADMKQLEKQQGYRFADAMIVVIDPLSIPGFNEEMKMKLSKAEYDSFNRSTQLLSDVLSGVVNTMEGLYHISTKGVIDKTLVVAFTKCDIPTLKKKIGTDAVDRYMNEHRGEGILEAYNSLCEDFLNEYGESNFLQTSKAKFKRLQFFACSALGHNGKNGKFRPVNVELPLLWVIDKLYKSINLESLWGKKI